MRSGLTVFFGVLFVVFLIAALACAAHLSESGSLGSVIGFWAATICAGMSIGCSLVVDLISAVEDCREALDRAQQQRQHELQYLHYLCQHAPAAARFVGGQGPAVPPVVDGGPPCPACGKPQREPAETCPHCHVPLIWRTGRPYLLDYFSERIPDPPLPPVKPLR